MGGKVYDDPDCKEELKLRFGEYLLFTYRYTLGEGAVPNQNNSGKISGKVKHLISDMGWGCMIRCGQMMIGNAIMWVHKDKMNAIPNKKKGTFSISPETQETID